MKNRTELVFLKKIFEQYRINVHVILESESNLEHIDKGVRKFLGLNNLYDVTADFMKSQLTPNTIYKISDDFYSNYYVMGLPNDNELCFLVIGPYTEKNFNEVELLSILESYNIPYHIRESLLQYYFTIPYISDTSTIQIILSSFYETIWQNNNNYIFQEVHHDLINKYSHTFPDTLLKDISEANDIAFKMNLIEERYQIEASLINYVSQGNYNKAVATLSGMNIAHMETRASTRLRDYKNYCIVFNTLLRKAAETGLVHPIHIDKLSSYFAKKIETIVSFDQSKTLFLEMIRKYCFLVKNHSVREYSLLIQKVVNRIETDLTADQSLKTHAKLLNVHPSYLSSIFRKETGLTLTEYVNQKRIEYSIFLLNTSTFP